METLKSSYSPHLQKLTREVSIMSATNHYATDLSDEQWAILERLLPEQKWHLGGPGRPPEPSAGSIDSQSVKTATQDTDVGFDRNKRVKGRKRHLLVDTLGLIVAVVVTAAHVDDRQGAVALLRGYFADGVKRLRKIWV